MLGAVHAQNTTLSSTSLYETTLYDKFKVKIDAFNDNMGLPTLRYNIEMPTDTYIGFGYSWGMYGVDMVAFMAGTDKARV